MADYDASASWSGYNYQGKIAIYYALKFITSNEHITDFSNFALMLEAIEDFELLESDQPRSYHQVKAVDENGYSNFKNALLGIVLQLYKKQNVDGYIHSWREIKCKKGCSSLSESVKSDIIELLKDDETKKESKSTIELSVTNDKGLSKTAKIIKESLILTDSEKIKEILSEIVSGGSDCLKRLKPYKYDDGNEFCDIDSINSKILAEVRVVRKIFDLETTDENSEKILCNFLGYLDDYIISRHKSISTGAVKLKIPLETIIDIVRKDLENPSIEYIAYKFKDLFSKKIDEYEKYCVSAGAEDNFIKVKKFLIGLTPKDLWEFYRNFTPHQYLNYSENIFNSFEVDFNSIQTVLLKIMESIKFERSYIQLDKFRFTYRSILKPTDYFLPTTIPMGMNLKMIEKKFSENTSMNVLMYEVKNYIYTGDVTHTFQPNQNKRTNVPSFDGESSLKSKRNEMIHELILVPHKKALEEFVND